MKMQWHTYRVVGFVALVNAIAWMILSALYETGIWVVTTPLFCLANAIYFSSYLCRLPWAYRWSVYYAIGTGVVTAAFVGESADYYGEYAGAMLMVECGVLFTAAGLVVVYFLPDVRAYFRAATNGPP